MNGQGGSDPDRHLVLQPKLLLNLPGGCSAPLEHPLDGIMPPFQEKLPAAASMTRDNLLSMAGMEGYVVATSGRLEA